LLSFFTTVLFKWTVSNDQITWYIMLYSSEFAYTRQPTSFQHNSRHIVFISTRTRVTDVGCLSDKMHLVKLQA